MKQKQDQIKLPGVHERWITAKEKDTNEFWTSEQKLAKSKITNKEIYQLLSE